jgi:hypothetical protein
VLAAGLVVILELVDEVPAGEIGGKLRLPFVGAARIGDRSESERGKIVSILFPFRYARRLAGRRCEELGQAIRDDSLRPAIGPAVAGPVLCRERVCVGPDDAHMKPATGVPVDVMGNRGAAGLLAAGVAVSAVAIGGTVAGARIVTSTSIP